MTIDLLASGDDSSPKVWQQNHRHCLISIAKYLQTNLSPNFGNAIVANIGDKLKIYSQIGNEFVAILFGDWFLAIKTLSPSIVIKNPIC